MLTKREEKPTIDGQEIAKIFKFYLQFKRLNLVFILPLKRVQAKSMYCDHAQQFDKFKRLSDKYKIDIHKYVKFFINVLDLRECDINDKLVNILTILKYVEWLEYAKRQDEIYKNFMKSVKNIVKECIRLGYMTTKDFIRYMIANKKLSHYFVTGQISQYYFAAIPNFKKIIPKLDTFSRDEFLKIYDRFEMYNSEITSAFMKKTNKKVNPIQLTDEYLYKARLSNDV